MESLQCISCKLDTETETSTFVIQIVHVLRTLFPEEIAMKIWKMRPPDSAIPKCHFLRHNLKLRSGSQRLMNSPICRKCLLSGVITCLLRHQRFPRLRCDVFLFQPASSDNSDLKNLVGKYKFNLLPCTWDMTYVDFDSHNHLATLIPK